MSPCNLFLPFFAAIPFLFPCYCAQTMGFVHLPVHSVSLLHSMAKIRWPVTIFSGSGQALNFFSFLSLLLTSALSLLRILWKREEESVKEKKRRFRIMCLIQQTEHHFFLKDKSPCCPLLFSLQSSYNKSVTADAVYQHGTTITSWKKQETLCGWVASAVAEPSSKSLHCVSIASYLDGFAADVNQWLWSRWLWSKWSLVKLLVWFNLGRNPYLWRFRESLGINQFRESLFNPTRPTDSPLLTRNGNITPWFHWAGSYPDSLGMGDF